MIATTGTKTGLATKGTKVTKVFQNLVILVSFGANSSFVFFVAAPATAQPVETIAEIRVHGNHTTPDTDIIALSGLAVGQPAEAARLAAAERALRESDRFSGVELRRRFRSIESTSDILVMLVVDEHPAVSDSDLSPGWAKRLWSSGMWLPILSHADGYGFTYGARVSFVEALGDRSRVSVPLTWGGERRAALELERAFDGPVSLLRGSVSINRRVNPHFDVPDSRREGRVEAERIVTPWLRGGVDARVSDVDFGPAYRATHTAAGVNGTIDTRIDPTFPRNAMYLRIGWERLMDANRFLADLRGYIGVGGAAVLGLRGQLQRADAALPAAEQPLLGGSSSLRGYRAGHRAGDSMAAASAELRLPINPPLSAGRLGIKGFVDVGTTWNAGEQLRGRTFDRGVGGGLYFGIAVLMVDLDVAWPERGKPRAHVGVGVSF